MVEHRSPKPGVGGSRPSWPALNISMSKENIFTRIRNYLVEVKGELKKVTWPSRADLQKTTIAVLVSSFIFGVYLYAADVIFYYFFEMVKNMFR